MRDNYSWSTVTETGGTSHASIGGLVGYQGGGSITNNYAAGAFCSGGNCADATNDDVFIGQAATGLARIISSMQQRLVGRHLLQHLQKAQQIWQ